MRIKSTKQLGLPTPLMPMDQRPLLGTARSEKNTNNCFSFIAVNIRGNAMKTGFFVSPWGKKVQLIFFGNTKATEIDHQNDF